jgi:YVTN family beta-propeller protein
VTNGGLFSNTVSVVSTASKTVIGSPITVGLLPSAVAVTRDGLKVYVTGGTVAVISTATNTVVRTIAAGSSPIGIAIAQPPGATAVPTLSQTAIILLALALALAGLARVRSLA